MDPTELLTVDELAHRAGTTTRTVRAYQTKGLIPTPRKIGRVAYYGAEHLARLQLIERLLARGFLLSAIGDLLRASEEGAGLAGVLGHPALHNLETRTSAGPRPAGDAPAPGPVAAPAVEEAEALRQQLASISDRFVDLLRREAWRSAVAEIRDSPPERDEDRGADVRSGEAMDHAGALQRELAEVSDQFVDLLRREAWKAAVAELGGEPAEGD
jgi:DNA-binding transcriptional MerR regulator